MLSFIDILQFPEEKRNMLEIQPISSLKGSLSLSIWTIAEMYF